MRKIIIITAVVLVAVMFTLSAFGMSEPRDEYQVVKKAVKENPNAVPAGQAKWFKVLVTDAKTGKDKVRVTLPLSVIDILSKCVDKGDLEMHRQGCNINLAELFNELKAAGPMMFVEVQEGDEIVKVWLE